MDVYNQIVEGINQHKSNNQPIKDYLKSLQSSVRSLRLSYRKYPVYVSYHVEDIQSAYLLTYLPHYYQLIQKILQEQDFATSIQSDEFEVTFIGGGPGSEAFGVIKYLLTHKASIQKITVNILDINARTWNYSHKVVQDGLINEVNCDNIQIDWNVVQFDLTSTLDIQKYLNIFKQSNLVVIQNCINEIATIHYNQLNQNISQMYSNLPGNGSLLMIDLTSSIRSKIENIEKKIKAKFNPQDIVSTLGNSSPSSMVSYNSSPSNIIRKFLLTGADGLIPRKYLKYDYSLIIKATTKPIAQSNSAVGFTALYKPLEENNLTVIDEAQGKVFVGVDFGTSITVVSISYVEEGKIKLETLALDQKDHNGDLTSDPLVPTVMGIFNKQFMLGKHAAEHLPNLEIGKNVWAYFKEDLGALEEILYPSSMLKVHRDFPIGNAKEGLITFFKLLLKAIIDKVTLIRPSSDLHYTWSVPANYSLIQKAELKECAMLAGFPMDNTPFVEEPVSALINYIHETNATIDFKLQKTILILDVGAGTVDVSILKVSKDTDNINSELLAVERISEIGGNKINQMMVDFLIKKNPTLHDQSNLRFFCERLKKVLCNNVITDKTVDYRLPEMATSVETRVTNLPNGETISLSFKEFYNIMNSYWEDSCNGIVPTLKSALHKANLKASQISQVILTGGGARNPYIKTFSKSYFNHSEVIVSDNIQEQVARGNALQAFTQHLFGKNIINSLLHFDVILYLNGKNEIIFDKGTVCPTLDYDINYTTNLVVIEYGHERIEFVIKNTSDIDKTSIYIDNDLNINCEVVRDGSIDIINPKIVRL
ncbi:Hsp70 family protein [Aureispira sp. CCB-E]|uniref:Hsp70 family protein n=1 Tax=Aureispira sp. CCB-E TaxID=3051121 RepID=UPI0028691DEE|nr:Hsp70 family protein [Aureispira sp. CCB-E]WMX17157.1 Hsp70 family protein [Aureispira sp. CCB-E]